MAVRKASARWTGAIREGSGTFNLPAAGLEAPYSFDSRFAEGSGSNPEELLGAAHAACFSMAFAGNLQRGGYTPRAIRTEAQVHVVPVEGGFEIPRIKLVTEAEVDAPDDEFQRIAEQTKQTCPVSKVLAAADITLEAKRM